MTTAQTISEAVSLDTDNRPQASIRDAIKTTGIGRDDLYDGLRDGHVRQTLVNGRVTGVDMGDVWALLGRPQPAAPEPVPPRMPMRVDRLDNPSPGDRVRAAAMLTGVVAGDRLAVTANMIAAQRAERVGATIVAAVDVIVDVLPELRRTELVDRLRAIAAKAGVDNFDR